MTDHEEQRSDDDPILSPIFAEHAAPEAIRAAVVRAKRKRRGLDSYIGELYQLLGRRDAEKAAGLWPGNIGEGESP